MKADEEAKRLGVTRQSINYQGLAGRKAQEGIVNRYLKGMVPSHRLVQGCDV